MSYQVLARKYRPRLFKEMVGQEHVLRALINALDTGRLHHAYLFTGTRGVGKTSLARILAKCLSCEQKVSSEPCGQCDACLEIADGRFVDLIEVDAASRTRVEDTRELLDNVQYAPTKGRYKIYLIDEVHMLSTHSFNALLKTLEEPPEHVKFLLATTDPQKLPPTILSRCLQFNLKNLTPKFIAGHLAHLLDKESVPFDDKSLWSLANAAKGSMRDALSLTDQAIAYCVGSVTDEGVSQMLGAIDRDQVHQLAAHLIENNPLALLQLIDKLSEFSPDYSALLDAVLLHIHRLTIAQIEPAAIDDNQGDKSVVLSQAKQISAEELQLFYQMGLLGKKDFPYAPTAKSGLEMALLRMLSFRPQGSVEPKYQQPTPAQPSDNQPKSDNVATKQPSPNDELQSQSLASEGDNSEQNLSVVEPSPLNETTGSVAVLTSELKPAPEPESEPEPEPEAPQQEVSGTISPQRTEMPQGKVISTNDDWLALFPSLGVKGLLGSIACELALDAQSNNHWLMKLSPDKAQLYNPKQASQLQTIISQHVGEAVTVSVEVANHPLKTPQQFLQEQAEAQKAEALSLLETNETLQSILKDYEATIDHDSVALKA